MFLTLRIRIRMGNAPKMSKFYVPLEMQLKSIAHLRMRNEHFNVFLFFRSNVNKLHIYLNM